MSVTFAVILFISCTQVLAQNGTQTDPSNTQTGGILGIATDSQFEILTAVPIFLINIAQRISPGRVYGIFKNIDISTLFDDLDNNLKLELAKFKGSEAYNVLSDATNVVLGLDGNIKTMTGLILGIAFKTLEAINEQYSKILINIAITPFGLPGVTSSLKILLSTLEQKLGMKKAGNFIGTSLSSFTKIVSNNRNKYGNVFGAVVFFVYQKVYEGYLALSKKGIDEVLLMINKLNLTNIFKNLNANLGKVLDDLDKLKVGGLVKVGRSLLKQIEGLNLALPESLLGGTLFVILQEVKHWFTSITQVELNKVVAITQKVDVNVLNSLDRNIDELSTRIRQHGDEGAILGVGLLIRTYTSSLINPFKNNMKGSVYVLIAALDALLQSVSTNELPDLVGTARVNYNFLRMLKQLTDVAGLPTI